MALSTRRHAHVTCHLGVSKFRIIICTCSKGTSAVNAKWIYWLATSCESHHIRMTLNGHISTLTASTCLRIQYLVSWFGWVLELFWRARCYLTFKSPLLTAPLVWQKHKPQVQTWPHWKPSLISNNDHLFTIFINGNFIVGSSHKWTGVPDYGCAFLLHYPQRTPQLPRPNRWCLRALGD